MIGIYNLIGTILSIILSPVVFIAFILKPKLRAGFWEKIGFYRKPQVNKESIWVHAVSVGEVNAVEGLVKRIKKEFPGYNLILTTVTRTGQEIALKKLSGTANIISFFPYDYKFSVKSAIKTFNPKIAIIAETEIWPNFAREINKANIPLLLVNGRISPGSHKGYKNFRFFFSKVLDNFSSLLMQSEGDRERIVSIGADNDKTEVMGNLKFDLEKDLSEPEIENLRKSVNADKSRILIAGSTHKGEDEIVLRVFNKLKAEFNDLKLIIAPRHPERHEQVKKLLENSGKSYGLRSSNDNLKDNDIIMLDTMGELGKFYSISDIAFIGGSFSGTGGHNPLEAAIYGIPVISGPDVFNFKDIYKMMTGLGAAKIAEDENSFYLKTRELLINQYKYEQQSNACLKIFENNKGATDYAISKVKNLI